ncbi:MAG: hypothetical protein MZV65_16605 [Chromatiales bacterium]|nr:hypothetical protein [Chromatiales bacterium]
MSDSGAEKPFYIRDEETGHFWSPTPLSQTRSQSHILCRHGFGYSVFEHTEGGIRSEAMGLCCYGCFG